MMQHAIECDLDEDCTCGGAMMTEEKIQGAFKACKALLPKRTPAVRYGTRLQHVAFMCEEGATYADVRREKSMRWLGFVQGTLWAYGLASIDELKEMNRP